MIRRALALLAIVAIAATRFAGRPLADVLRDMQQRGLNVVYSSDLVKPEMRVIAEPRANDDRAILDEILPPLGLAAKNGPGGVVLIVRGATLRAETHPPQIPVTMDDAKALMPISLAQIVVTASDYAVLGRSPEQRQFLSRDEVNRTPHLADDVFHTLSRLPGAATSDLSASFGVRGGSPDDVLVLIDGLEIAQPYHFRYFQDIISVFDAEAIGSLDYLSGGAPVEYGNRMSGVIDMSTTSAARTYAGVSFTHARLLSAGAFNGDRGQWLVSARRGYFDVLLDLFYQDIRARPRYGDVIGKLQYRIGDRSVLSANALTAVDHFEYHEENGGDFVHARYSNRYAWLNLRSSWTPHLSSQIVGSFSRLAQSKNGGFTFQRETADVHDDRDFGIAGMRQDWTLDRGDRGHVLKWGVDLKRLHASYDYAGVATIGRELQFAGNPPRRSVAIALRQNGDTAGFYAADRVRIGKGLTVEAGVRYESESWRRDDAKWTPRVNVVFTPSAQTAVRASWGEYRQAQRLDELAVADGDPTLYRAQVARSAEIGIEHRFANGIAARVGAYTRKVDHVRPRYENLFDHDEFFPEAKYDRVRVAPESSDARGVEMLVKSDSSRPFTWWLSLTQSTSVDRIASKSVPRSWDQPRATTFSTNYKVSAAWNFNVSGLLHTGWPTTDVIGTFDPKTRLVDAAIGERNQIRFPLYQRYDVRAMYSLALSHGTFSSWIDVGNATNQTQLCCGESFSFDVDTRTNAVTVTRNRSGVGWIPSFGIGWEF